MGFLFMIITTVLLFKATVFILKMFGKLLGFLLTIAGYFIIGSISVFLFGISVIAIPALLIFGVVSLIGRL